MKKTAYMTLSLFTAVLMIMTASIATAATAKDEGKLTAEITMLDAHAKMPQGEKLITKELTDNFKVKSDKITSLLGKNMKYGEVAAVLAFADKMPGGVTDANINQVTSLRQTKAGWSQIAKNLKVELTDVASKLGDIEDSAHKNIKDALAESPTGRGAGGGESEEPMEVPEEDMPSGGATGGTDTDTYGEGTGGHDSGSYGGSGGGGY